MHKPSKKLLNSDVKLDKYINTYEKKFFRDLKYISDSRRTWKEGCVCKKLNPEIYPKLHLLIHQQSSDKENHIKDWNDSQFIANQFHIIVYSSPVYLSKKYFMLCFSPYTSG
jgi:hypothetical protein